MFKLAMLLMIGAVCFGAVPYARSLQSAPLPPGVSAKNWVAMGNAAGFVVTGSVGDPRKGLRFKGGEQIEGYLMIRQGQTWTRVYNGLDAGMYQAALAK